MGMEAQKTLLCDHSALANQVQVFQDQGWAIRLLTEIGPIVFVEPRLHGLMP